MYVQCQVLPSPLTGWPLSSSLLGPAVSLLADDACGVPICHGGQGGSNMDLRLTYHGLCCLRHLLWALLLGSPCQFENVEAVWEKVRRMTMHACYCSSGCQGSW